MSLERTYNFLVAYFKAPHDQEHLVVVILVVLLGLSLVSVALLPHCIVLNAKSSYKRNEHHFEDRILEIQKRVLTISLVEQEQRL